MAGLRIRTKGMYVDCTIGQGGLAERLLETAPDGTLIGIDRDPQALTSAKSRLQRFGGRLRLIQGNFSCLRQLLGALQVEQVDGVVFDLGVSSAQLNQPERGFSFMADGPLDMRMDQTTGQTAAEILQRISEQELSELLFRYGEERYARRIARAIVRARARAPLRTTFDLVGVIGSAVPAFYRRGRIHFATRTFQALRIAVNRELDDLEQSFQQAAFLLRPAGRLCIVSFHSLEDRIAKRTLKKLADPESPFTLVTKKPIVPTEAERQINPRSRSAKLRILERMAAGRHT